MYFALPLVMLVALVGLGTLAAIVYGVVYAIANKRPGVAVGSVVAPVLGFIAICFVALTLFAPRSVSTATVETWHPEAWFIQSPLASIPPTPANLTFDGGANPLVIDPDFPLWVVLLGLFALGAVFIAIFAKRRMCEGSHRFGWGKLVFGLVLLIVILRFVALRVSYHPGHIGPATITYSPTAADHMNEVRKDRDEKLGQKMAQLQHAHQQAEAQVREMTDGDTFGEMFEQLNQPRIKFEANANDATMSVEPADATAAVETSRKESKSTIVVPISEKTQESLARSAARLEQMIDQVSSMADQVSDMGTLLGRAMVAINEQIDSRGKQEPARLKQEPKNEVAVSNEPSTVSVTQVAAVKVAAKPQAAASDIELEEPSPATIDIEFDRAKLHAAGLSFEKVRDLLGRDGLWRGAVVRFDAPNSRITARGQFDERYVARLKNTLVHSQGWQHKPVHLADLAEVKISGELASVQSQELSPPAWVSEKPKRVGNVWREVIESGEYATVEECYKAADIYLLLATYNHVTQLTGRTLRMSDSWRPISLTFRDDQVVADGKVIIAGGWIADDRLRRLSSLGIGVDFVRRDIAKDEYVATTERSFGPMKNLYTLVEFTPSVDAELIRRWNDYQREERFAIVGTGAGAVLGGIGLLLGLLKVDTWTKGYYTKRLFLGVPAAIIGVLALLGLAVG